MELPGRIRRLRTRRRMTLEQVARACGVTRSMLSKIETGRASPSVATLTRLAEALGVQVSVLLSDAAGGMTVATPAKAAKDAPWMTTDKGYRFFALAAQRIDKVMQPLLVVAEKGKVRPEVLQHSGEEFVYVLEGRMKFQVGQTTHELGPGDSLYFDGLERHDIEPVTAVVKYLAIFADVPELPESGEGRTRRRPALRGRD